MFLLTRGSDSSKCCYLLKMYSVLCRVRKKTTMHRCHSAVLLKINKLMIFTKKSIF